MDARTLEALEKSIAHHEACLKAETPDEVDLGAEACALCKVFQVQPDVCGGCPVYETTGSKFCRDTPWHSAVMAWRGWKSGLYSDERYRAAEHLEVDFLKSLRPAKADLGEVAAFVGAALIVGQLLFWAQVFA